jgi:hypothetical protein
MIIQGRWILGRPYFSGVVIFPNGKQVKKFHLGADTGASITMVSNTRNQIDKTTQRQFGIQTKLIRTLGGWVPAYEVPNCVLAFQGLNGVVHKIPLTHFYLAKKQRLLRFFHLVASLVWRRAYKNTKKDNKDPFKDWFYPPNVLGRDVLDRFLFLTHRESNGVLVTNRKTSIDIDKHPTIKFPAIC